MLDVEHTYKTGSYANVLRLKLMIHFMGKWARRRTSFYLFYFYLLKIIVFLMFIVCIVKTNLLRLHLIRRLIPTFSQHQHHHTHNTIIIINL